MSLVTVVFPDRQGQGRVGRCRLPWAPNKTLRHYMMDAPLKELGLVGYALRCKMYNRKKQTVRLTYTPVADDLVVMVPTSKGQQ